MVSPEEDDLVLSDPRAPDDAAGVPEATGGLQPSSHAASDPLDGLDPVIHPRPSLRRATWVSLDGTWDFRLGEAHGSAGYPLRIRVPFAPESPASGIGDTDNHPVVGYRRSLPVAAHWADRRVHLHLSGVEGSVQVRCDGRQVAVVERAVAPVTVDLTEAAQDGTVLELRVERDPLDLAAPRGKQDWLRHPHSIWYPRSSGLTRTVWLEAVPAVRVEAIDATGDLAAFALDLRLRFAGVPHGVSTRAGWRVRVRLTSGGEELADESYAVTGPELRRRVHLPDPGIDDARNRFLWRPERPTLIDVDVTLERGGESIDEVRSTTALRTVGVDRDAFLLNGRPYPLRLVLDQGYWPETHRTPPDTDALRRDVELVKALGFNGVRKHQVVEDPRYLAWADRLGLLVWAELPSAYAYGSRTVRHLSDLWTRMIERDAGHPSVVAWVAFNESWGVPDLPVRADQRHAVRALYHLAKALDPSRPVIGNDGWENVVGDLRTVHDYATEPAVLATRYGTPTAVAEALANFHPGGRRIVVDDDAVTGPVVLSEFGGVRAERGGEGWGYASVDGEQAFLARYQALLAAVHGSALAGFCYTQFADTFQEQNGLVAMDRRPKADLAALARATRGEEEPMD